MALNDVEYLEKLGSAIAARRKMLRLSQADLAYRAGMEVPNLSVIENGKSNPTLLTLVRICAALNTNLAELLPTLANPQVFLDRPSVYKPIRRKGSNEA